MTAGGKKNITSGFREQRVPLQIYNDILCEGMVSTQYMWWGHGTSILKLPFPSRSISIKDLILESEICDAWSLA